jgi:hypothetical protein
VVAFGKSPFVTVENAGHRPPAGFVVGDAATVRCFVAGDAAAVEGQRPAVVDATTKCSASFPVMLPPLRVNVW